MAIDPNQTAAKSVALTCGPSGTSSVLIKKSNGVAVAYISLADPSGNDIGQSTAIQIAAALSGPQITALQNIIATLHVAAATQLGFA